MVLLKILLILVIPTILLLPFLPFSKFLSFSIHSYPKVRRKTALLNIVALCVLTLAFAILMPTIRNFALWLGDRKLIAWVLDKIPSYASYSADLAVLIFINILYCYLAYVLLHFVETGEFLIKAFFRMVKKLFTRKKKNKKSRKDSRRAVSQTQQNTSGRGQVGLPPELLPTPEAPIEDGRITLPGATVAVPGKKNTRSAAPKNTTPPPGKDLKGWALIRYKLRCLFFEYVENTWYIRPQFHYVAKHLRNFLILVGAAYVVLFMLLLIPVFFHAGKLEDLLYEPLRFFLAVNYLYPVLSLVSLTLLFYLLHTPPAPIEPTEAPELAKLKQQGKIVDLDALDHSLMKAYGKDYDVFSFYSDDEDAPGYGRHSIDLNQEPLLSSIAEYVTKEGLVLNQDYLSGVQSLNLGDNVLFHAPLYSSVGTYLYAALNMRIMQGERIVVVCHNRSHIENYMEQLRQGFLRVTKTHAPLWRIADRNRITPDAVEDILVLCPEDFLDERLFSTCRKFFSQVTIALVPDANLIVASSSYNCEIIAQKLEQYASPVLQYLFLSSFTLLNLETALMDRFLLPKPPVYCRGDYAYGDNHIYVWRRKNNRPVLLDHASRTMGLETSIANIANQFGIPNPSVISGGIIYSNQVNPQWLDIYDSSSRPLGFAIVADDNYNLPGLIYSYSRYIGKKASVLHIISRQYLLRDYFYSRAPRYLTEQPLMERSYVAKQDQTNAPLLRLIGKLIVGLPVEDLVQEMKDLDFDCSDADPKCFDSISRLATSCITRILGSDPSENEEHFTLYHPKDQFYPKLHIRIREDAGLLPALIREGEFVQLRFNRANQKPVYLNLLRSMLGQRYIAGQYLAYDNQCYTITDVDHEKGIVTVSNTASTYGYTIDYVQLRSYTLTDTAVIADCMDSSSKKKSALSDGRIAHRQIVGENTASKGLYMVYSPSGFHADSNTRGYYLIDTDGKQLQISDSGIDIIHLNEQDQEPLRRHVSGGIYLRIDLDQQSDDRLTMSLAALLQEIMKTIFPDRYFCLSVCPILKEPDRIYDSKDIYCRTIAGLYPRIKGWDKTCDNSIELLILDDCQSGSGTLELLFDKQGTYITNLLWVLYDYLEWQRNEASPPYLYFGLDHQPAIFDFDGLRSILKTYYNEHERELTVEKETAPTCRCGLCSKRIDTPYLWHNTVEICRSCGEDYAPTEDEARKILEHVVAYLTDTFDITLPTLTVAFDPTLSKELLSSIDLEGNRILLPEDLPLIPMHMQILTQVVRIWQLSNLDIDGDPMVEGQIRLVLLQYLRYLQQFRHAHLLHRDYLKSDELGAKGYCALLQNLRTEGHDNSFLYLLGNRKKSGSAIRKTSQKKRSTRTLDDTPIREYHREQLEELDRAVYDKLLSGVTNRSEGIDLRELGATDSRITEIMTKVLWDHPEIFWINRHAFQFDKSEDGLLKPVYTMSAEEQQRRQEEIDTSIEPFFAEITDDMGDYEVALKLYEKIISLLDYDTIALKEQKSSKTRNRVKTPDDLRSIYGAIVSHKAVCAGYAAAYQFLLQKFGLEALYVCGQCHDGGYHAWSVVRLEGDYYHVDATWGDRSNTDPSLSHRGMTYAYFGLTDEQIRRSRAIDTEPPTPPCTAEGCNYFVREGLHFTKYDPATMKSMLAEYFKDPENSFLEFRFENLNLLHLAVEYLCNNGGIYEALRAAGRSEQFRYMVREDLYLLTVILDQAP